MTIGDMVVTLGMNNAPLATGVKQSKSMLSGFSNSIQKMGSGLGKMTSMLGGLGGQLAAFAGIGAFTAMTAQANELIDTTGKMAAALGMPVDQLSRLQHAAQTAGLDKLDTELTRFSRRMAFGAQGGGAAMGSIKKLGLDAGRLAGMDTADAFMEVSDIINALPTQSEKMAAAFQLFGNSSKEMLDLIGMGSEGLAEKMKEADFLGKVITDSDVQAITAANDAMDRMKGAVGGMFNQIAVATAPLIEMLANGFTSIVPTVQWAFGAAKEFALDAAAVIGWGIENAGSMMEWVFKSAALNVVSLGADIKHTFTVEVPTIFGWFTENFVNMFTTAGSAVQSVFVNLSKNIGSIMSELWKFISSGGTHQMAIAWTPLLDGFENTIGKLPDIPDRMVGELEQSLRSDVNRIGQGLGNSLGETMLSTWADRNKALIGSNQEIQRTILPNAYEQEKAAKKSSSGSSSSGGPAAAQVDTTEAYQVMVKARAAQEGSSVQYKEMKRQTALLQKIVEKEPPKFAEGDVIEEIDL